MNSYNIQDSEEPKLVNISRLVCTNLKSKWEKCSRTRRYFLQKESGFLSSKVSLPKDLSPSVSIDKGARSRGRPEKQFEECSKKTKKRKVENLVRNFSADELRFAADVSGPSTSSRPTTEKKHLSLEQTLALYLDLDLSERKYNLLGTVVNNVHSDTFPSLYKLNQFKKQYLPEISFISETVVELNIQDILNKTVNSISQLINIECTKSINSSNLTLVCKWGMDGSSGHSTYKQKFLEENQSDEFMFLIAFVPLMLIEKSSGTVIWKNPRSSSSMYCRPLKFLFSKENANLVKEEYNKFENFFKNEIQKCNMTISDREFNVNFEFHLTMIDGSVCNTITETRSCSTCYVCGAKPSEMNKIDINKFIPDLEKYKYGLSTLHSWIRFFECCLKIAYRLPFKKGRATKEYEGIKNQTKKRIQDEFKKQLGLSIDKPKPGYGSSNDGNTARNFFENYKISATITGLNEELIFKFYTILRIINCKKRIDLDKFNSLIKETRELYLRDYSWYNMPMTVHKILVHGYNVISQFEIPIGELSEECLEARHKEIRKERLAHTRKRSRTECNSDLMNRLVITSDPMLTFHRNTTYKKGEKQIDDTIKEYFLVTQDEEEPLSGYNFTNSLEDSDEDETGSESE